MPKFAQKTLTFPLAGIGRRAGYREQTRPYSAPWAMNVRGKDVLEGRTRGGSRPGLVKVSPVKIGGDADAPITVLASIRFVTPANILQEQLLALRNADIAAVTETEELKTVAALQTPAGVDIFTEDGKQILVAEELSGYSFMDISAHNGCVLIADANLKKYTPTTGVIETLTIPSDGRTRGTIPTGCPLVCSYRGRVILTGADHVWYASRQGDMLDWNFGADMNDSGRAVAGQLEHAGKIGDKITAVIPFGDTALLFATANGLWLLKGDPATGTLSQISSEVGMIAPRAWAQAPSGLIAFLSNKGIYVMAGPGDTPKAFSEDRAGDIDGLFRVNPDESIIIMVYDHIDEGFMLFVTPEDSDEGSIHWWIDVENKALWPFFLEREHCPTAATRMLFTSIDGYTYGSKETILGCLDRYLRMFSSEAADDDSVAIPSHVLIGPFRLTTDDTTAALLTEIHGMMGDGSGEVTWRICVADTAEEAADIGKAGIESAMAGTTIAGVAASGTWGENRNRVERPRVRGSWAVVWLEADEPWAFEAIAVKIEQLGRLR